jgi:hypothetical protein
VSAGEPPGEQGRQVPREMGSFVQRTGRSGRGEAAGDDGESGAALHRAGHLS